MENREDKLGFRPKARLMLQLGDQLIRSESIAILELIKNSYDACAKEVKISLSNLDNKEIGEIIIEDNGWGMDKNTIEKVWLQPGTTYKKNQIETGFISPCNRIPLGEKGIGRFGAHKLGRQIELISKTETSKEVYLKINWEDFDNDYMLDDIAIDLIEREPEVIKSKSGTKIVIKNLHTNWTRGGVRELFRAVNSLNSPFESLNSFRVKFRLDKQEWLSGLLKFEEIKDNALFSATATLSANKIISLDYNFIPWPELKPLKGRHHHEDNIDMSHRIYDEKEKKRVMKDIDLSAYKIGEVKLQMLIFDFDTSILTLGGISDKKGLKDYLKMNGGMRVYREGIRVYDYGEPGNDWLNLDIDRVNFPTARISNNIVIGAIQLNRIDSKDLIEKTNREGFIDNEAFFTFHNAIRFTLGRIITQRNIDKDKLRNYHAESKKIPVYDNLEILREKIAINIKDSIVKDEVLDIINEIGDDYKTMSEVYIRSASAGLSLSIVIHEIEKIIQELLYVVDETNKEEKKTDRIKSLTTHLGKLIDGYSGLIRRRSRKESDLKKIITDGLWNVEFRLKAHNIEVIRNYEKEKNFETVVKSSDSLLTGTIVNIIDNSIWWMNYGKVQNKKIFVDISNEINNRISIIIADNGPGFSLIPDDMVKPFISNKEGGIGIGLHLANEIMNSHGGELLFPDSGRINIPDEFATGAIIALAFPIPTK